MTHSPKQTADEFVSQIASSDVLDDDIARLQVAVLYSGILRKDDKREISQTLGVLRSILKDARKARPSNGGGADDCGDEDEDDDELFLPCEICGEEHPEGVLDGDRCPACVDLDDEEGA